MGLLMMNIAADKGLMLHSAMGFVASQFFKTICIVSKKSFITIPFNLVMYSVGMPHLGHPVCP